MKNMDSQIVFEIEFPQFSDSKSFIDQCNLMITGNENIYILLKNTFDNYVHNGKIVSYKRRKIVENYLSTKLGEIDFCKSMSEDNNDLLFAKLSYNFVFSLNSPTKPVEQFDFKKAKVYQDHIDYLDYYSLKGNLFTINEPWYIKIDDIKLNVLKTQKTQRIDFSVYVKRNYIITKLIDIDKCSHEFRLVGRMGVWNWKLLWGCIHCGVLCHCSCFSQAINFNDKSEYPYIDNACEVCRQVPSTHQYCHKMYARSDFEIRYGAYVKKKSIELIYSDTLAGNELKEEKMYEREAINILREELGFKKIGEGFIIETELYRVIRSLFKDNNVIHHYHSKWLGRQEIDIYIEELKIGVEYQGEQHYKPVKHWGGTEGLAKNLERDERKRILCQQNGVVLIEFKHDEKDLINAEYVYNKIIEKISLTTAST